MSEPAPTRMTVDEFIAWAMEQPEGEKYELADGEIVAMAPERLSHADAKSQIGRRLAEAIEAAGLNCRAIVDGPTVAVDDSTSYQPDVFVRCGPPPDGDPVRITDPIIVVEVLSRSTKGRDTGSKLVDYFRIPSVRHYLIARALDRVIIHHERAADGGIMTRIVRDGPIVLDPPGITLTDPFPSRV